MVRRAQPGGVKRAVLAGVVTVVLLAGIAAAASSGSSGEPGAGADPRWLADGVLSLTAAVVVIGTFAILFGWRDLFLGKEGKPEKDFMARLMTYTLLMVIALAYCGALIYGSQRDKPLDSIDVPVQEEQQKPRPDVPREPAPNPDWSVVSGFGLLVLGGVVLLVMWPRLRPQKLGVHEPPVEEDLTPLIGAVDESLDALMAEPDDRLAVIAAYQRMELLLARAGLGRERWEAPFEHLERVLVSLGGSAATARRLVELFERAKFSHHPVGPEMRQEAIDALTRLREELTQEHARTGR